MDRNRHGWLFVSFWMERRHFEVLEPTVAHMMETQPYNKLLLSWEDLADLMSWSQVIQLILLSLYLYYLLCPCLSLDCWNGVKIPAPALRLPDIIKALNLGPSLAAAGVRHHAPPFDPVSLQGGGDLPLQRRYSSDPENRTELTVFEWRGEESAQPYALPPGCDTRWSN